MFRLMMLLFAFLWSALLDTDPGGGGNDEAPAKVELTEAELTQRTTKAAEEEVTKLAGILGVDLSSPADVKALIEAGRKAQQQPTEGKPGDDKPSEAEGGNIKDQIAEFLKPITDRLGNIEQTEQQRQQAAAEETRDEKLTEALKGANVRDDRLAAARTIALANGAALNDKGELVGTEAAIAATKKALPEAFRGDGDDGKAADASGRERTDRKPKSFAEAVAAHYSKS